SPTGVRSDPVLVTSFNVGVGNAGAINVTLNQTTNQPVILLSQPVGGNVALYGGDGTFQAILNTSLPAAAQGIDENGIPRPTGSAFISEFIRPTAFATLENLAPTGLIFNNTVTEVAEDEDVTPEFKVADLLVEDDALGTNNLFLTGQDKDRFLIRDLALYYVGGTLDFETQNSYEVTVNVDDETVGTTPDVAQTFTLNVTDVNEAPTAVTLTNTTTVLPENTDTTDGIKVADVEVTDDALGTNTLSLLGNDQDSFEIRDQ
ncbi:MAG: cadherin repeat domain-containing protein, partial [Microcystaceae cyanobacterium]